VVIRGTIDDGSKEQRVLKKSLDRFDEKGREVPRVGEGRSESSGMLEVRIEGRRFRKVVQVFEGRWMSCDVLFVRRF